MSVVQLNNPLPTPKPAESLANTLEAAKQQAVAEGLKYAGKVSPEEAWKLFVSGQAHLVDVRATEEIHSMWLGKLALHSLKIHAFYANLKTNCQKMQ